MASAPHRMEQSELKSIFNSLKPKQSISVWFDSAFKSADSWTELQVGRKSKSKKYNLEKISLIHPKNPNGSKYYLYNRQGRISFAMGDMGTSLIAIKTHGKNAESFSALDYELNRNDCCELWVEKLYDGGKIGFGEAGNLLAAIEMDGLKCSQLGSAKCHKNAESFEADYNVPKLLAKAKRLDEVKRYADSFKKYPTVKKINLKQLRGVIDEGYDFEAEEFGADTHYRNYDGYFANKPELENLHRCITNYLRNERPIRDSLQGDLEYESFDDRFRQSLMDAIRQIEGKLSYGAEEFGAEDDCREAKEEVKKLRRKIALLDILHDRENALHYEILGSAGIFKEHELKGLFSEKDLEDYEYQPERFGANFSAESFSADSKTESCSCGMDNCSNHTEWMPCAECGIRSKGVSLNINTCDPCSEMVWMQKNIDEIRTKIKENYRFQKEHDKEFPFYETRLGAESFSLERVIPSPDRCYNHKTCGGYRVQETFLCWPCHGIEADIRIANRNEAESFSADSQTKVYRNLGIGAAIVAGLAYWIKR